MMLAVTMRGALEKKYGAKQYEQIRTAMEEFGKAAGAQTLALDDAEEMKGVGAGTSLGPNSGAILSALRQFTGRGGGASSVLLVGGDEIIPYWVITNPVTDRSIDADEQILSDNPYGSTADSWEQYVAPSIPVGRLTDFPRGTVQDFLDLLATATTNRRNRPSRSRSTAVVNAEWVEYSKSAATALPGPVDWYLAPGYRMNAATGDDTDRECLYFNLHGFSGQAAWKGYDEVRSAFVTAVTPDAFARENVSGTVVFAENCYGAQTVGRTPDNSCALRLVREGAAMIGATGVAYGAHLTPDFVLDDADQLAKNFWTACSEGQTIGAALGHARAQYLGGDDAVGLNPFKKKTLLQFVLLGDLGWTLN
jgi:hypothetical protein